jgi:hypothetical protein
MGKMCKKCSGKSKAKVGAITIEDSIYPIAATIAGAVVAQVVKTQLLPQVALFQTNQALAGGVLLAGGIALNMLIDNDIAKAAGLGMAAVGAVQVAGQLAPKIAGIGPAFSLPIGATSPVFDLTLNGVKNELQAA